MSAIFKREMRAYFTGGTGWVFCSLFAIIMNVLYYLECLLSYKSNFITLFNYMLIILTFLVPLMTMRIWSEEKKQKIDQLLLTAPVGTTEIVLGKYFAAVTVLLIALALTLPYPLLSVIYGTPEHAITIGNYIAIILAGGAYIAVSQFMASLTESQIISALLSLAALLFFILTQLFFDFIPYDLVAKVAGFLSIPTRFLNFTKGIFSFADAFYFISLSALFIFFTSRVIESRRWN